MNKGGKSIVITSLASVLLVSFCAIAGGQLMARPFFPGGNAAPGAGGAVNLPYLVRDNQGNQWRLYQGGWLQQQGNMPLYSQGGMLLLNGQQIGQGNNQARLDPKTNEVIFENLNGNGFSVTRRILIDPAAGLVRYVDVIKNTGNAEATVNFQIQSNLNYGVNVSTTVPDPKKKGQDLAWVAQTGAGPSVVEVFAGKGSKLAPAINAPQGNSFVQATMPLTIAAGKEVAVVHLHASAPSQDAGVAMVNGIKENDLLKSIPREIRKLIVNFKGGQGFIGDLEILRGDLLDIVELKSGDQFKGTLQEKSFVLQTFYGTVELPVDRVIALVNVGQFRPRQLIVTTDGQIFGGTLKKETIDLQLSSGQITQVPLSQMSRAGYRKRDGEPEEWTFEKPIVLMRTGERVGVQMPTGKVEVITRYGKLELDPAVIAAVTLQGEDSRVHEIQLMDGSKFAGLLSADRFDMKLDMPVTPAAAGAAPATAPAAGQAVTFPASSIARLQFSGKVLEPDDTAPTIELSNDDSLVGTFSGQLKLDTAFDTITVNASEIKTLVHSANGGMDVSIALWDGTTLSGQLQVQAIPAKLAGGVEINIPVPLLVKYEQPQPQPSAQMIDQIKAVITKLNADDWKERDRAEATIVSMGPVAIVTLKQLRVNQPPEAQQRIDSILKELEKQRQSGGGRPASTKPAAAAGAEPGVPVPVEINQFER